MLETEIRKKLSEIPFIDNFKMEALPGEKQHFLKEWSSGEVGVLCLLTDLMIHRIH